MVLESEVRKGTLLLVEVVMRAVGRFRGCVTRRRNEKRVSTIHRGEQVEGNLDGERIDQRKGLGPKG